MEKRKVKKERVPSKSYNLYSDGIKKNKLYSSRDGSSTSDKAKYKLYEECKSGNKNKVIPGQLIIFEYKDPITKEDLEYYDAFPCTIFFNNINTPNGKRVLGFNLHYYPPKMRYVIMNGLFNMFKPFFLENWNEPSNKSLGNFTYNLIINKLKRYDLDFGVRMYDPKLMSNIIQVPPKLFSTAVFTEGIFKKKTKENIYKYWKNWSNKKSK